MNTDGLDGKSGDEIINALRKQNDNIMDDFYKKLPKTLKPKKKGGGTK